MVKLLRRSTRFTKLKKTNGKIRFKRILWYSFKTKRYEPNDFSKILKTSEKLKYIQTTYGYRESDLLNELNKRKQFLTNLIDSNIVDNGVIQEEIGKFYRGMSIYATATI